MQAQRTPRPVPKREVQTQFEEPVDEEAVYFSEIAMENALTKPREPIAEKQESDIYLTNAYDRDPGIRLND